MYKCYVFLGDPTGPPVWEWSCWAHVAAVLDPLLRRARGKPLVRSGQFIKGARFRSVPFGRLAWSESHHQKWTHNSPMTANSSKVWDFYYVEVSAPSYPKSYREGEPPDIFLTITNEAITKPNSQLLFNPTAFVAVATDIERADPQIVAAATQGLAEIIHPKLSATKERAWGSDFGGVGWVDGINSISHTGLFKVGDPHERPLDLDTFQESWDVSKVQNLKDL